MNRIRQFISAVTFIGVIFHEFGHKFFCDVTGVKVKKVCWFRLGNPAGYVLHERPHNFLQTFFVAVGPLITGTAFALLFYYIAAEQADLLWQKIFFTWLGAAVAIHSFPGNTDAKNLWRDSNRHLSTNLFAVVGYPFSLIIWLANSLFFLFFDILYALFLYHLIEPFAIIGQ